MKEQQKKELKNKNFKLGTPYFKQSDSYDEEVNSLELNEFDISQVDFSKDETIHTKLNITIEKNLNDVITLQSIN